MQPTSPINTPEEASTDNSNQPQKINQPETPSEPTTNFIDIFEQTKAWLNMIPDVFISEIRGFFEAVKCSNSVDVYDRHRVQVEYDTLQLSKIINKSATSKSLRITNVKLGLIRNMIYLYLAFNKKADYRKSWTNIAYTVLTLGLNEEENFYIFAHLLENVLSGFFLALKNYQKKRETVADLYLLAELKSYIFPAISSSSLDLKAMKTLPQFSKNNKNKTSNTFTSLFNIPKIFRTKPQSISISSTSQSHNTSQPYLNQKGDSPSSKNSYIKNYELFCLIQAVADIWFGTLFTNILSLNQTLELWDYLLKRGKHFIYQFALALLTQLDLKLATIIKKERMTYFSMGIEDPQSIFSMLLSPIKQALENPLGPVEFQATLKMALSLEKFVKENREQMDEKRKQIVKTTQAERVRHLLAIRKELEAKSPLSEQRVKTIIKSIDEYDMETLSLQDVLNILKKEQTVNPYLGSKIFSFIDSSLKGHLEPTELKTFFILLTETPKKKLQLIWEELGNKRQTISVDEAIKVFQVIDQFIIPSSSQIDEKVADIYQTWIRVLPDYNVSVKDFVEFFQKCKACKPLLTILETIDGTVPLKSELSFDEREPLQTRGTTRQQEKNFESFIDFSINDERNKTIDDAKSKSSKSDLSIGIQDDMEGRLASKENRNDNSMGNIVTLFDSARNKIRNFARSLSANKSKGSARSNPTQGDCPLSKSYQIPQEFEILCDKDVLNSQATPGKQLVSE